MEGLKICKYLPKEGPEEWEYEYLKGVTVDN